MFGTVKVTENPTRHKLFMALKVKYKNSSIIGTVQSELADITLAGFAVRCTH